MNQNWENNFYHHLFVCTCKSTPVEPEDNLQELILSFYRSVPGIEL